LIYKGKSHNIQDSWVDELGTDTAYFASSDNRWSCNKLRLDWLQKVFELHTKSKAGRGWHILIVDGHLSHVNIGFLNWALEYCIIIYIMPLHSTHKLQPLDVSLFGPLATAY
jgi:DDE superfamily endonuclease